MSPTASSPKHLHLMQLRCHLLPSSGRETQISAFGLCCLPHHTQLQAVSKFHMFTSQICVLPPLFFAAPLGSLSASSWTFAAASPLVSPPSLLLHSRPSPHTLYQCRPDQLTSVLKTLQCLLILSE